MAKSKRFSGFLLVLILLAAAGAGTWYYLRGNSEKPPEYVTAPVVRTDITQAVTATGALQPVKTVEVGSQISGIIEQVLVDYNSVVKQGQVVAQIDPATYQSRLRSAEAELANAEANYKLVRVNAERTELLNKNGLVPQSDLDQAQAQLAQAEAQVKIRVAAVESAKVDLSRCTIYAPIDGVILARQVDAGKTVAASLNTPVLFTIANDLTKMQIVAAIAEADIGNIEVGQNANFTVDAFPNRQFHGRVALIRNSPITVQNVVTYETLIDVRNEDQKLRPGMTANVSVVIGQRTKVLRISNMALRVRLPDVAPPAAPAGTSPKTADAALKPLPSDQRRTYLAKAGWTPGSGRPTEEQMARAREAAKADGFEWPAFGAARGGERTRNSDAPVTRIVYRLVGKDENAHPEAVNVKLGLSDGTNTEVVEGLSEGDLVITSVIASSSSGQRPSANPFGGPGRRRF